MSDPIQHYFKCCRLRFLNSVLSSVSARDDVQFRDIRDPAAINLPIKVNSEHQERQNSICAIPLRSEIVGDRELNLSDLALDLDAQFCLAVVGGENRLAVFGFGGEGEPEDFVGIVSRSNWGEGRKLA